MIVLQKAHISDLKSILKLFTNTVEIINLGDYSIDQVNAWSSRGIENKVWKDRIKNDYFILALMDSNLVGFASLSTEGCIDMLFVHHEFQNQGIATLLLNHLLEYAETHKLYHLYSDVSITAKGFFEKMGFEEEKKQTVFIGSIAIDNFKMVKKLY